jgi:hypothetical protein
LIDGLMPLRINGTGGVGGQFNFIRGKFSGCSKCSVKDLLLFIPGNQENIQKNKSLKAKRAE